MAKLGAKVVVNDLGAHFDGTGAATATPAQEVVAEIKKMGGDAVANGDNVADFKAAKNIVDTAIKTFGKLNIVVNNAGILRDRMIFNMDEESWDSVVAVHLKGTFNMARHACEYWREEHKKGNVLNGRIINTASDAGLLGNVGQSNYGACKAAVAVMAIIIGHEMKKYGVTANAIAPVARTRLTVEATPSTAGLMGGEVAEGEFDMFSPANIAPAGGVAGQRRCRELQRAGVPRRRSQRVADAGLDLGHPHQEREAKPAGTPPPSARASRKSSPRASPRARTWPKSSPEVCEVTSRARRSRTAAGPVRLSRQHEPQHHRRGGAAAAPARPGPGARGRRQLGRHRAVRARRQPGLASTPSSSCATSASRSRPSRARPTSSATVIYLAEADLILVMTEEQRRMLGAFEEAAGKRVLTLRELAGETGDIEDPVDAVRGRVPALPGRDRAIVWSAGCRVSWRSEPWCSACSRGSRSWRRLHPTIAVARELRKEVEVAGELVVRNVGSAAELTDLETVLVAGGTRRIDLELPLAWRGPQRIPAGGELRAAASWKVALAAPMRAPTAEIQLNTTAGGKRAPLCLEQVPARERVAGGRSEPRLGPRTSPSRSSAVAGVRKALASDLVSEVSRRVAPRRR